MNISKTNHGFCKMLISVGPEKAYNIVYVLRPFGLRPYGSLASPTPHILGR